MNVDTTPPPSAAPGQALPAQPHPEPVSFPTAFGGAPINILIVDDEPKNLTVLETVLNDPGYRLVRAGSADEALLALVVEEFALLILDICMPGMTGFELAQLIKERKKTARVPIIFLTAYYADDENVLEGYGTGAVDYLFKPVNPAVLRSKVAVFAELHRKNRENAIANRALLAEVTDRRRAEEKLRELTETLEQRVAERTEALRESEDALRQLNEDLEQRVRERSAALEAANRELEAFCYSVAHDLRSPLRGIDGFSLAVLQDYSQKLDAEGQSFLNSIRTGCQKMGDLIDDLLKLSRVNRVPMQQKTVDLAALAHTILNDLQRLEPGRVVQLRIAEGLVTEGDPHLLEAALRNLLENAWKFTNKRAEAVIEIGVQTKPDKAVSGSVPVFFVRDNGAGFDMAHADKLFAPFQRMHSVSEYPGTGVGLATVQRIFQRHGGRIWAEAAVERGATFNFTINEKDKSI